VEANTRYAGLCEDGVGRSKVDRQSSPQDWQRALTKARRQRQQQDIQLHGGSPGSMKALGGCYFVRFQVNFKQRSTDCRAATPERSMNCKTPQTSKQLLKFKKFGVSTTMMNINLHAVIQ
jgi:hypothetical protein